MKIGLVGPSYQEYSLPFDAQRSINCYAVFDKEGKETSALYGAPGKVLFADIGNQETRNMFFASNGRAFAVVGSTLYEVFSNGSTTSRGSLDQNTGNISIDENGFQLAICDGESVYILTYSTNVFVKATSNIPSAGTITFIDGYFVVNKNGSGQFNISALFDGLTWAALDFATAESSPDNLLRVINAVGQLWLFGSTTTEIFTNTGASAFPFERISGAKLETGILAPHTAVALDNTVFWLGRDERGSGIVFRASGFTPKRVSTSPIERIIRRATSPENMKAWTYQQDGRTFYVLTGGGIETSLVYDLSTGLWHERAYLNEQGEFEQDIAACSMYAFNKTLVGDRRTGKIYELSDEAFDDAGEALAFERIYTHLSDEGKRIRFNNLEIGIEAGVGTQTGQGFNPQIIFRLSKDGAKTWSMWYTASMGKAGKTQQKVVFRRLGVAEQMTFAIRITDPVKRAICGSYLT